MLQSISGLYKIRGSSYASSCNLTSEITALLLIIVPNL